MSFIWWNCCGGISSKYHYIRDEIAKTKPEVFFVIEAELRDEDQCLYQIQGYNLCLDGAFSRIIAYVKNDQKFTKLKTAKNVLGFDNGRFRVYGLYREFKKLPGKTHGTVLNEMLQTIFSRDDRSLIVGGDFNINLDKIEGPTGYLKSNLDEWSINNTLTQMIRDPTWRRVVTIEGKQILRESRIDHLYTNTMGKITQKNELGDHDLIRFEYEETKSEEEYKIRVRDWRKLTNKRVTKFISKTPLGDLTNLDVEESTSAFNEHLVQIMDKCAPLRTVRLRQTTDYINVKLEAKKKRRDRMLKKYRKTGEEYYLSVVKDLNKSIKLSVNKEKRNQIQRASKSKDPKSFWKVINDLEGKGYFDREIEIIKEGLPINGKDIPEVFATFFEEKITKLSGTTGPYQSKLFETKGEALFKESDLTNAIPKLTSKKSMGVDGIPMNVVKFVAPIYTKELTSLFNKITTERYPKIWRTSVITPLHKKGSMTNVENYRPISNLCSLGKFYEKCLLEKILECSVKNGIDSFGDHQHAYRKNHSTTTAGLTLQSLIANELDKGKECMVYSVDLSAAFDLLRPKVLEEVMDFLPHSIKRPIIDFLTDREFVVEINKVKSAGKKISIGCVQGSVLGPCLFSIYCRNLATTIRNNNVDLVTYADDTYVIVKGDTKEDIKNEAEKTLTLHCKYLEDIGMVINKGKTEITYFSNKLVGDFVLNVGDQCIKSNPDMKVLGVTFEHNLDWTKQTQKALLKANLYTKRLQMIRKFLTKDTALRLITAFYFSMVYYGSAIWMTPNLKSKNWKLLEAAHYRVMRIAVEDYPRKLSRTLIDNLCERATPRQWSSYITASSVIKIIERNSPAWLCKDLKSSMYVNERRIKRPTFHDRSRHKIGKQCLKNRLTSIFKCVDLDWHGLNLGNDTLRVGLKKSFFPYFN